MPQATSHMCNHRLPCSLFLLPSDFARVLDILALLFCLQGFWRIAVYNPMRLYQIGYKLTAVKLAHCLNDCSGHGSCDDNGTCQCNSNWAGGDCSVNQAGGGGCQEGSHQSTAM